MRHIAKNNIVEISTNSENANFPISRCLDEHPKRKYRAANAVNIATVTADVVGGCSGVMVAGTNAASAILSASDPNAVEWVDTEWGKTSGSVVTDVVPVWVNTGDLAGATHVYSLLAVGTDLYAGTSFNGDIFKSIDGGTSWVNTGDLAGATQVLSLLAVGTDLYAGTGPNGDIFKSTDGGTSWVNTGDLAGATHVLSLLAVGTNLYAGGEPNGDIFKSIDGGTSWVNTGDLAGATQVLSLLAVGTDLYAGTGPNGDIFKSTDGGTSWVNTGDLAGVQHVYTLLAVGTDLYAGTSFNGDIFKSIDGGTSWVNTGDLAGATHVLSLLAVGTDLYAGTYPNGDIFKSTDGGTSWVNTGDLAGATYIFSLLAVGTDLYAGTVPNGDVFWASIRPYYTGTTTEWANKEISVTGSVIQRSKSESLWIELSETLAVPVRVEIVLTAPGGQTLEAGVITANLAETYGGKNPRYGITVSRIDYSIRDENSNGSGYYKKRDIVRVFDIDALFLREDAFKLLDNFDEVGELPTGWRLTDQTGNEWVVYGKFDGPPQVSHDHPTLSAVNFRIIEVL